MSLPDDLWDEDFLGGIDVNTLVGLRDRALIAVMAYALARASATVAMTRADYRVRGKRGWVRLGEKGGKCGRFRRTMM